METLKGKEDKGRVKEVLRKTEMEIKEGWKGKNKGRTEGDIVAARTKKDDSPWWRVVLKKL